MKHRFLSIDLLKVFAVIGMIIFHIFFVLNMYSIISIDMNSIPIVVLGKVSVLLFTFLFGFNLHSSAVHRDTKKYSKRISILSLCALIVTISTLLFIPNAPVYFGILHFFAFVSVLFIPLIFFKLKLRIYVLATLCSQAFFSLIHKQAGDLWFLFPFGYYPKDFVSIDYYPIFQWIYIVIFGYWVARLPQTNTILEKLENRIPSHLKLLTSIGKYSLFIYMVHVPVILLLLFLINY